MESESGTEIADSRFLIIYEKPADPGFGLPSLVILFSQPNKTQFCFLGWDFNANLDPLFSY